MVNQPDWTRLYTVLALRQGVPVEDIPLLFAEMGTAIDLATIQAIQADYQLNSEACDEQVRLFKAEQVRHEMFCKMIEAYFYPNRVQKAVTTLLQTNFGVERIPEMALFLYGIQVDLATVLSIQDNIRIFADSQSLAYRQLIKFLTETPNDYLSRWKTDVEGVARELHQIIFEGKTNYAIFKQYVAQVMSDIEGKHD